ncbi:MAG: Maf family nucleotide pyrophosphatase [Chromatiales bacterium]|nr:Maf family nucleotide pyrophosphatase [Chromatiales bacterium]
MIILASASPRRAELLQQIGISFEKIHADIDESLQPGEGAEAYVMRLAGEKAKAVYNDQSKVSRAPVLGADTVIVVGDKDVILGKPSDYEHFRSMMVKLSGRRHRVLTAIALLLPGGEQMEALSISNVLFRHLQESEIEAYWQSGEPADKAGGYAVQGLGAIFIENLEGSYSGVMGLPLFETAQLLNQVGITTLDRQGES